MREATRAEVVIDAAPGEVLAVIGDIEAYPKWTAFTKAVVLEKDETERPILVEFSFDMGAFKDEQTMRYEWPSAREGDSQESLVRWQVVTSNLLKSLTGSYLVIGQADSSQTRVVYELTMEVSMPLISAMRKRAEKMIVDTALQGLKKRVESLR
jgi:ribosome-associated toxin RatA of RatAB toxin-antitoxin module